MSTLRLAPLAVLVLCAAPAAYANEVFYETHPEIVHVQDRVVRAHDRLKAIKQKLAPPSDTHASLVSRLWSWHGRSPELKKVDHLLAKVDKAQRRVGEARMIFDGEEVHGNSPRIASMRPIEMETGMFGDMPRFMPARIADPDSVEKRLDSKLRAAVRLLDREIEPGLANLSR